MKVHKIGLQSLICLINAMYNLGSFYFTLGNLPPMYRSKLSSIYLVALVKSKFISDYGMDVVLKPIVDDIKKLVSVCKSVMCMVLFFTNRSKE